MFKRLITIDNKIVTFEFIQLYGFFSSFISK